MKFYVFLFENTDSNHGEQSGQGRSADRISPIEGEMLVQAQHRGAGGENGGEPRKCSADGSGEVFRIGCAIFQQNAAVALGNNDLYIFRRRQLSIGHHAAENENHSNEQANDNISGFVAIQHGYHGEKRSVFDDHQPTTQ